MYYMWKRKLPFVKDNMKESLETKIRIGWTKENSDNPQEQQLLKIISFFLEKEEVDRIDLRNLENIIIDDCPLF